MKKVIISVMLLIASISCSYAQNYTRSGKTFVATKTVSTSSEKDSGFTYQDTKGVEYHIFVGNSGSCYIKKTSQKTGKEYKQYLGEEISREICKSLKIEYKGKSEK